jgi:hypothetical protein
LRHGWYIVPAYIIGFFIMLWAWNWHPDSPRERSTEAAAVIQR